MRAVLRFLGRVWREYWSEYLRQAEICAMAYVDPSLWPSETEGERPTGAALAELEREQSRAARSDFDRNRFWNT